MHSLWLQDQTIRTLGAENTLTQHSYQQKGSRQAGSKMDTSEQSVTPYRLMFINWLTAKVTWWGDHVTRSTWQRFAEQTPGPGPANISQQQHCGTCLGCPWSDLDKFFVGLSRWLVSSCEILTYTPSSINWFNKTSKLVRTERGAIKFRSTT